MRIEKVRYGGGALIISDVMLASEVLDGDFVASRLESFKRCFAEIPTDPNCRWEMITKSDYDVVQRGWRQTVSLLLMDPAPFPPTLEQMKQMVSATIRENP